MIGNVTTLPVTYAPILCPFCEEVTLPNLTPLGDMVCSCAARRKLPKEALDEFAERRRLD